MPAFNFSSVSSASAYKERRVCSIPQQPLPTHTQPHPLHLAMAQPHTLKSFNPFITHPFTNGSALKSHPSPAKPSEHPRPIPTQYTANAQGQTTRVSSATPSTVHSPQPTRPITLAKQQSAQRHPKPFFEPFQQDRSSPDLEEILLRKQLTRALGPVALGQYNGYPPS